MTPESSGRPPSPGDGTDRERRPGGAAPAADAAERLATPDDTDDAAPPLRWAFARFLLLVVVVAAAFAAVRWTPLGGYLERQELAGLLARLRAAWWAPAAFVGIYVVLCPLGLPVSPLVFAGGAVFGAAWGALWNGLGTFLGAAASYGFARGLGREFVARLARGGRLRRTERRLARADFWSLVAVRFVPVPFPLVNFAAALAGVPAGRFLAATAVGLTPSVVVYTVLATALMRAAGGGGGGAVAAAAGIAIALLFLLTFLPRWWLARRRRRRYRELVAARRERGGRPGG